MPSPPSANPQGPTQPYYGPYLSISISSRTTKLVLTRRIQVDIAIAILRDVTAGLHVARSIAGSHISFFVQLNRGNVRLSRGHMINSARHNMTALSHLFCGFADDIDYLHSWVLGFCNFPPSFRKILTMGELVL
jgi:hypothetical protein